MGETAMRLGRVRPRSLRGAKRWFGGWVTVGWMWVEGALHHRLNCLWWFVVVNWEDGCFFCGSFVVKTWWNAW